MNRVKKISRMYEGHRPQMDQMRTIRSHTRSMRKAAVGARRAAGALEQMAAAFRKMNVKELRKIAAEANIKGRSKMNKDQLITELIQQ